MSFTAVTPMNYMNMTSLVNQLHFLSRVAFVVYIDLYHKHLVTSVNKMKMWHLQCTCCLHCSSVRMGTYKCTDP